MLQRGVKLSLPLDLHQRLSEFSYGYGVTREVEEHLRSVGLRPTPFLPSLVQEAKIGADVYFNRPGGVLLIQFKLGQELKRFRRAAGAKVTPQLEKPFWRFQVDTATLDGQYDRLLKSEQAGEEVYYVAPRFANWDDYAQAFENNQVLEKSLLLRPSEIDLTLASKGEPDGWHRVVYDTQHVYVCSEPEKVMATNVEDFAKTFLSRLQDRGVSVNSALTRLFNSFGRRRDIRMQTLEKPKGADGEQVFLRVDEEIGQRTENLAVERQRRLNSFQSRARQEGDAIFAAVGLETWSSGSQLYAVTLDDF